jgi:hypothetical protein
MRTSPQTQQDERQLVHRLTAVDSVLWSARPRARRTES